MNPKRLNHFILLTALMIFASYIYQHQTSDMLHLLDEIFKADEIEVTIAHHGGYTASFIGNSVLHIKNQHNDSIYLVHYKDAIDRRQLTFTINQTEYNDLKERFSKLIQIHNQNKKLSGDCLIIDQNYTLETKNLTLTIKPDKNAKNAECLNNWIYSQELNKQPARKSLK